MKEEHEKLRAKYLTEYIYEKHNQDKCLGFIDGFEKAIQALSQSENKPIAKEEIEYRIKEEFKKHKELDWAKIAASKIYALLPQPPKLNNHENN